MCHPSVSALLTLAMVDLPGFETLTATVQSTADSLQERTQAREWCTEAGPGPPFGKLHGAMYGHPVPDARGDPVPPTQEQLAPGPADGKHIPQLLCG